MHRKKYHGKFESHHNFIAYKPERYSAIWHPLFFIFTIIYLELILHLFTSGDSDPRNYGYIIIFSVAYACLLSLLSFLPCSHIINSILLGMIVLLFCTQFFLFQSFQNFMSITAIKTAASDVASGFRSTLITMLLKGIWIIALFALPFLIYVIFGNKFIFQPKRKWVTAVSFVLSFSVFFGLGILAVHSSKSDEARYQKQFEFSAACQKFGLLTGTRLDLKYLILGNDSVTQLEFIEIPEDISTEEIDTASLPEESEAETICKPEYSYNILDIDFDAINESVSADAVKSMNDYISTMSGSKQNDYTGLFYGKNLIFITAESFSDEVVTPAFTPTLYRLATKGIEFTEYYQPAWGGSTSTGEYSNLTGLIPTDGVSSIQKTKEYNMYFTLGNQLQRLGYFSAAYHNGSYTYYDRHKTHCNLGYSTFVGMGNGMEVGVTDQWPESDLEMMQFTLQDYIDQQPFSIYYMTVSGHGTYQAAANAMSKKNWDVVADLDVSDTVKGYYAANLELEYALEYLVQELEKAGIADNTVIVLATDHYPYALEASDTWGNSINYLPELYGYNSDSNVARDHSRLIIWSKCLEDENLNLQIDTPTYSLDIVPTLSNLFGLEYDSRLLVGRDVFSEDTPLVIWRDYSWKTDKGYYDAGTGTFTPEDGTTADEAYIGHINALVQNKFALSNVELTYDYYGILFGTDNAT